MLFDTMEMIKCYTAAGHIYAHTDTYSSPLPHTFAAVNSNIGVSLTYTKKGLCNTQETYSFMYPSPQRVACCHLTKSPLFYLEKRIATHSSILAWRIQARIDFVVDTVRCYL